MNIDATEVFEKELRVLIKKIGSLKMNTNRLGTGYLFVFLSLYLTASLPNVILFAALNLHRDSMRTDKKLMQSTIQDRLLLHNCPPSNLTQTARYEYLF